MRLNVIKTKKPFINSSWCQVRNSSSEKKDDSNVNGKRLHIQSVPSIWEHIQTHFSNSKTTYVKK